MVGRRVIHPFLNNRNAFVIQRDRCFPGTPASYRSEDRPATIPVAVGTIDFPRLAGRVLLPSGFTFDPIPFQLIEFVPVRRAIRDASRSFPETLSSTPGVSR